MEVIYIYIHTICRIGYGGLFYMICYVGVLIRSLPKWFSGVVRELTTRRTYALPLRRDGTRMHTSRNVIMCIYIYIYTYIYIYIYIHTHMYMYVYMYMYMYVYM